MTTKGLLSRERSVVDARAKAVRLSPEGQALLEAARPRVAAADKRIMALVPKARRDNFLDLLCDLASAADAAPDLAKADAKAARKALKEAKKAEKSARKATVEKKPKKAKAAAEKASPAKAQKTRADASKD
jgi:hypothetical protein